MFAQEIKRRSKSKLETLYDADGRPVKVETRENEEQHVKYGQIIDLLLAAGYFRARIKGLSPFDKVVGGLCWCITTSNFEIDVDLLFQENLNVGQKISLTEKIVSVLLQMKCPHRIEPHQIQGMDFINIFPVMQWLVKKAIATRAEMEDYVRSYGIYQFNKNHKTPKDEELEKLKISSVGSIEKIKTYSAPKRKFRRIGSQVASDEKSQIYSTLLEYGHQLFLSNVSQEANKANESEAENKPKEHVEKLMSDLTAASEGKIAASSVGGLVSGQAAEIRDIISDFASKQAELTRVEKRLSPAERHERTVAALQKKVQRQQDEISKLRAEYEGMEEDLIKTKKEGKEMKKQLNQVEHQLSELTELEKEHDPDTVSQLKALVVEMDSLKKEEKELKEDWKAKIEITTEQVTLLKNSPDDESPEQQEKLTNMDADIAEDSEKLSRARIKLAKKNREVAALQRKLDSIPSRAELNQYQKRFLELYDQVSATLKETRQFYTLYNSLEDQRLYLSKELDIMNSIYDAYVQIKQGKGDIEQFLNQMEQIVKGVESNKSKIDKKLAEEAQRRDELKVKHQQLVEKQREYFKTVRDFQEVCRENELLTKKMNTLNTQRSQ